MKFEEFGAVEEAVCTQLCFTPVQIADSCERLLSRTAIPAAAVASASFVMDKSRMLMPPSAP